MLWIELERQRCATPLLTLSDAWTHSASVDSYRAGKGHATRFEWCEKSLSVRGRATDDKVAPWSSASASLNLKDDGR
jgi:hypothetical protein